MKRMYYVIIISLHLALTRCQLSFQPPNTFYNQEQGTGHNVSCLYAGSVNNRTNWKEGASIVSATHQLDLSTQPPTHHTFLCVYTPDSGPEVSKQLTVNIYKATRLQLSPNNSDYSFSPQLSNSTPFLVRCLGYGAPLPLLEWREDDTAFVSATPTQTPHIPNTSLSVLDLVAFAPGTHHLSCFGFNGYSEDRINFNVFVDASSPLLITPQANSSLNSTLIYYLEQNTTLTLHCSVRSFSLPLDSKWLGLTPFWSLATPSGHPTAILSNTSTLSLSNNTLGYLACVLNSSLHSTALTRLVHVSFVRHTSATPTQITTTSTNSSSTNPNTYPVNNVTISHGIVRSNSTTTHGTSYTANQGHTTVSPGDLATEITTTLPRSTADQMSGTATHMPSSTDIYLSPISIALIIAVLITLLCISQILLLSVCCLLAYRHMATRHKRRVQYINVTEDTVPYPNTRRDSNQYSQMSEQEAFVTDRRRSGGLALELGYTIPIYERIPEDVLAAVRTSENAVVLTSGEPQVSSDNSANTSESTV